MIAIEQGRAFCTSCLKEYAEAITTLIQAHLNLKLDANSPLVPTTMPIADVTLQNNKLMATCFHMSSILELII